MTALARWAINLPSKLRDYPERATSREAGAERAVFSHHDSIRRFFKCHGFVHGVEASTYLLPAGAFRIAGRDMSEKMR
jgi:hypothetical protein